MKKYRDEIAMVCHEMIKNGYQLGIVSDAELKEFEVDCFAADPEPAHTDETVEDAVYAAINR